MKPGEENSTLELVRRKFLLEQDLFRRIRAFELSTGAAVASVELRRSKTRPAQGAPPLESVGLWVAA